jgi:hypothetical protein
MMPIHYEWCCEQVERATEDIVDNYYADSLEQALGWVDDDDDEHEYHVVLVRYHGDRHSWAYLTCDGTLPEFFADACGNDTARVPQRFHRETAKQRKQVQATQHTAEIE